MRIFRHIKQSHQAFLIFCPLGPKKSQKRRKSLYILYSFHLTDKGSRKKIENKSSLNGRANKALPPPPSGLMAIELFKIYLNFHF